MWFGVGAACVLIIAAIVVSGKIRTDGLMEKHKNDRPRPAVIVHPNY
jgi:hypothetical protein